MQQKILTSSVKASAKNYDPNLLNPMAIVSDGRDLWVAATNSDKVIKYSTSGKTLCTISVQRPTGLAYVSGKSKKEGHCCGVLYVASANGAVYRASCDNASGVNTTPETYLSLGGRLQALAYYKGKLFITTMDANYVRVFQDQTEMPTLIDDAFVNTNYKPYGLTVHGHTLYITFSNGVSCAGNGYVDSYNLEDSCETYRLINRGPLQNPYGLAIVEGNIWVASACNGQISIYARQDNCLVYQQQVSNSYGAPLINDGLMGLWLDEKRQRLYFVAANDDGLQGSLGLISL